MKKIDVIRPGSINAIIGPVGTLKRIIKNANFFNDRSYEVSLITNDSYKYSVFSKIDEIPVHRPAKRTKLNDFKLRISSTVRKLAINSNLFAYIVLRKEYMAVKRLIDFYISQNRLPDLIQFHSNLECYLYLKYRKEKTAKTVMFLHTDGIPLKMTLQYYKKLEGSWIYRKMKEQFDWTVANVDHIVFIAKVGQRNFLSYYPERNLDNTSVIINGIEDFTEDQYNDAKSIKNNSKSEFKYRLCCTGSINGRKGHDIIIDALHEIPSKLLSQIHVDFLGEGSERLSLMDRVKNYNLERNVTFWGTVPNVDVYKHLAENNIYILMSKNEGLPISIIEAMRSSLAIISTNVSGIPELINHEGNGFLIEPNVKDLVDTLTSLDKYDIEDMGKASRIRFEQEFTFERMKSEFCNMYDKVLK